MATDKLVFGDSFSLDQSRDFAFTLDFFRETDRFHQILEVFIV